MKIRFGKFIGVLGIALVALVFASQAHAQVVPTNLWKPNYASSTIAPINSSLQVPCANIVGGCSSSSSQSLGTTSTPTFAGVTVNGNVTGTSIQVTGSSTSYITGLNGSVPLPSPSYLSFFGCPGYPTSTTIDTCANDWYNYYDGVASSVNFTVPPGNYTWTDSTGFLFNNPGETASLNCTGGRGTVFRDNAATGTFGTINWGTNLNGGMGVYYCSGIGDNTIQTSSAVGGLQGWVLGGSNGAPGTVLNGVFMSNFSADEQVASNTYHLITENSTMQNGGYDVYAPNVYNTGESNIWSKDFLVNGANATTSNCLYFDESTDVLDDTSNDGCQISVGSLGHVVETNGYHESTQSNTYGAYPLVSVASGGEFDETNGTYWNDGVGASSSPEFIYDAPGGIVRESQAQLNANPSSTAAFIAGGGFSTAESISNNGGVSGVVPQNTGTYLTSWEPVESYDDAAGSGGVNQTTSIRLYGPFAMPYAVVADAITVDIVATDTASDLYDFSIYSLPSITSTIATKVFDTGAVSSTIAGVKSVSSTQGTVYFTPGDYLVGITGASTTLKWGEGLGYYMAFGGVTGSSSTAQVAPATTSVGAVSWVSSAMPTFSLHM